jgi:hypothetical protein
LSVSTGWWLSRAWTRTSSRGPRTRWSSTIWSYRAWTPPAPLSWLEVRLKLSQNCYWFRLRYWRN